MCRCPNLGSVSLLVYPADKMIVYIASATTSKGAWDTKQQMLELQGALSTALVCRKLFFPACKEGVKRSDKIFQILLRLLIFVVF